MSERAPWDWPSRADERRRYFERVIDVDYRVVRRRQAIGFLSCLMIVGVTTAIILRFAWAPILMAFELAGVTSVREMLAVIIGAILLAAAALRERLSGKPF